MGFRKPDLVGARRAIGDAIVEIKSPYNDGWTSSAVKHDLYQLKCWLNDIYPTLPHFTGEEEWEKDRCFEILKRP